MILTGGGKAGTGPCCRRIRFSIKVKRTRGWGSKTLSQPFLF
jgi:hypothetical protein